MRLHVRDLTRRFPTIVIAVAAIPAVFSVLLADEGDRYVFTFAGTGEAGDGGDGGPATEAQLSEPRGLALDGSGNLYVADSGNHRGIDAGGSSGGTTPGNPADRPITTIRRRAAWTDQPLRTREPWMPVSLPGCPPRRRRSGDGGATRCSHRSGVGRIGQRLRNRLETPSESGGSTGRDLHGVTSGSPPSQEVDPFSLRVDIAGTGVRRRRRNSLYPVGWRWTGRATSTWPTRATSESGSSDRRGKGILSPMSFRTSPMAIPPSPTWCW